MSTHKEKCESLGIKVNTARYRRYNNAGLLDNLDIEYVKEIQNYWEKYYSQEVDPILHLALFNLTGKKDVRVVPGPEMWHDFIPYFNDRCMVAGYKDKNIYDILIETPNAPKIILKRVRGHYFNTDNKELDFFEAEKMLINSGFTKYIVKPSNTNNGMGIELLEVKEETLWLNKESVDLTDLEDLYGYNFMIQEVIKQHSIMKEPHPASVNTLRMVTQRWNNKIEYLQTFARFGAENSVKDNAGTGGVCVGVKGDGSFLNFAIDEDCHVYKKHPTTNYSFGEMPSIPNFDKYIQFVKDLHKDILHMDFISWDVAVGENGEPIFIEANFAGATWLYQLSTGEPMFGEMTEEILQHVQKNREVKRDIGHGVKKLLKKIKILERKNKKSENENNTSEKKLNRIRKENKNFENENKASKNKLKQIREENKTLAQDISRLRVDNTNILTSTSWKVTAPLRAIKSIFRTNN